MFRRPRLQGKTYVSARVDPSDSSLAQIEFTNIGATPLKGMDFLVLADDLPPVKNTTVNPSETKLLGKVRPTEAAHPTEIMVLSDEYFPQFFFVGRQSDGVMAVTEDGYGGHQGYAEYFVRTQIDEATSARRWRLLYKILKISGVVIGVLAIAVVSFVVGRHRSAPTEVK